MELFRVENLSFAYERSDLKAIDSSKNLVLENINLRFFSSDFLALTGANGGGKSTLIKLILGLLSPQNPHITRYIDTTQMGYVPQITQANPHFAIRAIDCVAMGLVGGKSFGFAHKLDKDKARNALSLVGIENLWDRNLNDLSGGQRQRVFIARALVGECKILLLDEPSASVDKQSAEAIFALLDCLHKNGVGILLISHDVDLASKYANKVATLNHTLEWLSNGLQNPPQNGLPSAQNAQNLCENQNPTHAKSTLQRIQNPQNQQHLRKANA